MDTEIEQQLWEFIDGRCTPAEKLLIENKLSQDNAWQQAFSELMQVHALLGRQELEMPSLRFSKNVMEEIARYQISSLTGTYINKNIIRGIGAFFLVMIAGFSIYSLVNMQWTNRSASPLFPTLKPDAARINLSRFLTSGYANIFMAVNVILGLLIIDKFIGRRKKTAPEAS